MTTEILIFLTIGVVEVIKRSKKIKNRYLPLIALIIGIGLSFIASLMGDYGQTLLIGAMIGLSSIGLYSGQKAIRGK